MNSVKLSKLTVGYGNTPIVRDIDASLLKGKMTCILGSNGAGKTTILKTIAGLLPCLGGQVDVAGRPLHQYKQVNLAKELSVVLSGRIDLASMTGFEVAAMGRYPHTGYFGMLTENDTRYVADCLDKCSAGYLSDKMFHRMSDGEKQKILIARGLAQATDVLLLDEPTSHLDIRHKLEVLETLKSLCVGEEKTVICTLHEPDLAIKCADYLMLVRNDSVYAFGKTDEVVAEGSLEKLYGFGGRQFNPEIGLVEFRASDNKDVFMIGCGRETPALLRALNRNRIGFAAGVLHENDISCHIAATMDAPTVTCEAYGEISEEQVRRALEIAREYKAIVRCDFSLNEKTQGNQQLYEALKSEGRRVFDMKKCRVEQLLDCL